MLSNEAGWDRVLRVLLGVALLSQTVVGWQSLWGLVGLVPLATGLLGHCPLYQIVGLQTCPVPKSRA